MTTIMIRFGYDARYMPRRGRMFITEYLNAVEPVEISDIAAADAPVAYRVWPQTFLDDPYEIRLHEGALWWPLYGDHGPLTLENLSTWARTDPDRARAVLDPLGRTYRKCGESYDDRFADQPLRAYESDFKAQLRQLHHDAARVASIDGIIHVDAGAPVWFAVHQRAARASYDLVVGPSSLDRQNDLGIWMPCPDRGTRLLSARLGRAYGLGEQHELLAHIAAESTSAGTTIEDLGLHTAGPAAQVCATAWAQHLWDLAGRCPELREAMPALARATRFSPPPADLPAGELLELMLSIDGIGAMKTFDTTVFEANLILGRLSNAEHVATNDFDDAVSDFLAFQPESPSASGRNGPDLGSGR